MLRAGSMDLRGAVVGVLLIGALAGCVSAQIEAGDRAARSGDWDAAVERYAQALEREPRSPETLGKLAHAREQAASMNVRAAEFWLERGEFDAAIAACRRALAYRENAAARLLLEHILREKGRAEAEQVMTAATRAEALGDLETAVTAYGRAFSLDPERRDALGAVRRVNARLHSADDLAEQARGALRAGDLGKAERLAGQALELHPRDRTAAAVIGAVSSERAARRAAAKARTAEASGDWEAAVEFARRAVELRSTAERVFLVKTLESEAARQCLRRGDEALRFDRWEEAVGFYGRARAFGMETPDLRRKLQQARRFYELSLAQEAEARGDLDAAIAHYGRANEIAPDIAVTRKLEQLNELHSP